MNNAEHIWVLMARKLAGEATAADLQELEELLRQNPHINYSKEILQDFWRTNQPADSHYSESKYRNLVQQIQQMGIDEGKFTQDDHYIMNAPAEILEEPVPSKKKWWVGIAALSALVIGGALLFLLEKKTIKTESSEFIARNEINTKNGSRTTLILPDGTKVWLNASSQLTYEKDYGNKLREVSLSGEAYFDVVKNKEKPFVIHTTKMDVKVLGTAFNVKCYPGEKTTETSLVRGSIEVTVKDRSEKITLKPNEKLVINNQDETTEKNLIADNKKPVEAKTKTEKPIITLTHLTLLPKDNTIIETAWVQNRLIFSSESFEEVVLKMERWYNVNILIKDEFLKEERLTGNFEKETITEALDALQFTTKFNYILKNNTITIYKKEVAAK